MASGTKLQLTFTTTTGTKTWTYNYAKPSATAANVKTLMNTMIENGSIYESVPIGMKSAKLVTTNESEYDLS